MSCLYNGNIAANTAAPDVQVTIVPNPGVRELANRTMVAPKGAVDPNPDDDTVDNSTLVADFKLNGGGLGCSAVPGGELPAAGAGFLATLLGLVGLRRRRR